MTFEEFIQLVHKMREAQREYFRIRGTEALSRAKNLEKAVDVAIKNMKEKSS